MPEFIVIIKAKGDPHPHCAVPVEAESAHSIMLRIEAGQPVREKSITAFVPASTPEPTHREKVAAVWKERLATLGTHWGAQSQFCKRYGIPSSRLQYWLRKFPPAEQQAVA